MVESCNENENENENTWFLAVLLFVPFDCVVIKSVLLAVSRDNCVLFLPLRVVSKSTIDEVTEDLCAPSAFASLIRLLFLSLFCVVMKVYSKAESGEVCVVVNLRLMMGFLYYQKELNP